MNKWLLASALLLLLPPGLGADGIREISRQFEVGKDQRVRIEIPVAELEIEAIDGLEAKAELTIRCRWGSHDCESTLERLDLEGRSTSRRLTLELSGLPRWHGSKLDIEGTILVPRAAALEVEMAVGELNISGIEQDLRVDVGVGEVRACLPAATPGRVLLDVGVGRAELMGADRQVRGRRSFLVGSEVRWDDGPGEARVDIEVGVGEVDVCLE